jgi:hypothetical protein
MLHGVVMNVVQGSPKMSLTTNQAIRWRTPNLPSPLIIFPIPKVSVSTVHPPNRSKNIREIGYFQEQVIVIWQKAPGMNLRLGVIQSRQKLLHKAGHPALALTHNGNMFEAGGSEVKTARARLKMGWTVPWPLKLSPPIHQSILFSSTEFSPAVHRVQKG